MIDRPDHDGSIEVTRNVVVISPHFDDVPLSLGESLRSGALSHHRVRVRTVFGRTNWTTKIHPTAGRAPFVSMWRRLEETMASVLLGYRWTAANWPEVVLREGNLDSTSFLDPHADLTTEPLVGEIASWLSEVMVAPTGGRGHRSGRDGRPDLVLVPAGLGGHRDHMIIAAAAARSSEHSPVPIGFYEDRPYRSYVTDDDVADRIRSLVGEAVPVAVSRTVRPSTHRIVRLCYPSQMTTYFAEAMERDRTSGSVETVWFSAERVPTWFTDPD